MQIELPAAAQVVKVVISRDREGHYRDRMPLWVEVRLSLDGQKWETVGQVKSAGIAAYKPPAPYVPPVALPDPPT